MHARATRYTVTLNMLHSQTGSSPGTRTQQTTVFLNSSWVGSLACAEQHAGVVDVVALERAPRAGAAASTPGTRDASTVDPAMSVSATERAIMRLTLTQMLRRRMLYSTRGHAVVHRRRPPAAVHRRSTAHSTHPGPRASPAASAATRTPRGATPAAAYERERERRVQDCERKRQLKKMKTKLRDATTRPRAHQQRPGARRARRHRRPTLRCARGARRGAPPRPPRARQARRSRRSR